jgi:hypothetical protein
VEVQDRGVIFWLFVAGCILCSKSMAIDDSFDAVESQYPERKGELSQELATVVGGLAFPKGSFLFDALGIAINHFSTKARLDRALAFIHALIDRVRALENREAASQKREFAAQIKIEELAEAIQIACYRDAESFNDTKRERLLTVLANASLEPVDGLVAFIQDIERLNEADIAAMKLLYEIFPQRWDLIGNNEQIHPNDYIQKADGLLDKAVPAETGSPVPSKRPQSYEDFYSTCGRLAGFGLAIEVQMPHRMVPTGKFVFRPSSRGLRFLDLLK